jgi:DNA-binding response OmpR family regulator
MATLLVVEDEPHIASGLRFNLEAEGHTVEICDSGETALTRFTQSPLPDCVVLDVMLPGLDGFEVAARLRADGHYTPILMLTARGRAEDVLNGFSAGADDYLSKPFDLAILVARVHALLRRSDWHRPAIPQESPTPAPETFTFGGRTVDFQALELRAGSDVHPLTLMEVNLLRYLIEREGRVVSRKSILEDVWNLREDTDTRAIDHFIARLRKYVEDAPSRPRHLVTVRSVGYRFVADPPDADRRDDQ